MAIEASEDLNNTFWALTGLRMPYANEDKALRSAIPLNGLANDVLKANEYISGTLLGAARALPPQVGNAYLKAVSLLVDDGGTNHLKNFADQLMEIADGRRKTAMNIVEGKVQLIAEVVRLILELLVLTVLSVFSGGASAGDIAIAKATTRLRILTILDLLIKRTHLMPSVSEAFEEAFTTFAVRLSLIAGGPDGLRPKGIDWGAIGKDGLFGALGGAFSHALPGMENKLKNLLKTFDEHSTFDSKNLVQDVTKKLDGPGLSGVGRNVPDRSVRDAGTLTGGNGLSHALGNVTSAGGGAVRTFTYEGFSETMAEFLGTGLTGEGWELSGATMLGAACEQCGDAGLFLGVGLGAGALFASKFNFANIASVLNAGVNAPHGCGRHDREPCGRPRGRRREPVARGWCPRREAATSTSNR